MILRNRPPISEPIPNRPFSLKSKSDGETNKVDVSINLEIVKEPIKIKEEPEDPENKRRVRARNADGEYIGDDPSTPENEAWVEVDKPD
jgi:hypothetical protein